MNKYRIRLSAKVVLISVLLVGVLLLNACDSESIVVPNSDNTPPIVSMSVDFTTSEGQRQTIELTSDSANVSFELDPNEPFAALASAQDTDGGVMGIRVFGQIDVICENSILGNDYRSWTSSYSKYWWPWRHRINS